jgi:hypothetical protein
MAGQCVLIVLPNAYPGPQACVNAQSRAWGSYSGALGVRLAGAAAELAGNAAEYTGQLRAKAIRLSARLIGRIKMCNFTLV